MSVAGRGAIDSIDLCDSLKKEVCLFFANEATSGNLEKNISKLSLFGEKEMVAIIKFRTDFLTLERLVTLKDEYVGSSDLIYIKNRIYNDLIVDGFEKFKLNKKIKELLTNGDLNLISLDSLVNIYYYSFGKITPISF